MVAFLYRYSGFCAWRGVLDYTGNENSEIIKGLRRVYPELGNCLYFDLESRTHNVLYELGNRKINWIWYVNQPEPQLKVIPCSYEYLGMNWFSLVCVELVVMVKMEQWVYEML